MTLDGQITFGDGDLVVGSILGEFGVHSRSIGGSGEIVIDLPAGPVVPSAPTPHGDGRVSGS